MPERRNRASSANTTVWACTECKRRKGKCSGDSPCTFCRKANRTCNYEARPIRLPLTRKNLDFLQSRCAKLEILIRTLDPSIDIDAVLSSGGATPDLDNDISPRGNDGEEEEVDGEDETFPENACGFEWHEFSDPEVVSEIAVLSDGMANLNVDSRDVGYLGNSSGAALLRTVHRLISRNHQYSLLPPPPSSYISRINHHIPHTLTSSFISSSLIDAYFTHYHPMYPILHEPTFRLKCADMSMVPETSSWRLIYYMVLTVGAFTSYSGSDGEDIDLDLRIWNLARGGLSTTSILESGTLERVQALALIGQYLQKRDRPNTGYNMMGTAVRMGLGLGLHRDFSETNPRNTNTLGGEIRRRVWWLLYIFDVGASVTFGRPAVVSDRAETRIPHNVDDSTITSPSCILPQPTVELTPYFAMISHAELLKLTNRIHSYFTSRQHHQQLSRELIHAFDSQILAWKNSLPSYFTIPSSSVPFWFREPRTVILLRELNLRMIMYKRFLPLLSKNKKGKKRGGSHPDKDAATCISLALETVALARRYIDEEPLRRGAAWYCTYFVFQAALVLVIAILKTEEQEKAWLEGVETAEECLKAARCCLGEGAVRCLDVLTRVRELWRGDRAVSPAEVSAAAGVLDGGGHDLLAGMQEWGGGMGLGLSGADIEGSEFRLDSWMVDTHGYEELVLDPSLFVQDGHLGD